MEEWGQKATTAETNIYKLSPLQINEENLSNNMNFLVHSHNIYMTQTCNMKDSHPTNIFISTNYNDLIAQLPLNTHMHTLCIYIILLHNNIIRIWVECNFA